MYRMPRNLILLDLIIKMTFFRVVQIMISWIRSFPHLPATSSLLCPYILLPNLLPNIATNVYPLTKTTNFYTHNNTLNNISIYFSHYVFLNNTSR